MCTYVDEARTFFTNLYPVIPDGQYLALWTKSTRQTDYFTSADEAAKFAVGKKDVFFHLALQNQKRSCTRRGNLETAGSLGFFWVDLDFGKSGQTGGKYPPDFETAYNLLLQAYVPYKPTCLVSSGGGVHAYYAFEEIVPINHSDPSRVEEIKGLVKRFLNIGREFFGDKGFSLDPVGDLARVFRVPGTYNVKNDSPKIVALMAEYTDWDRRFEWEALKSLVTGSSAKPDIANRTDIPMKSPKPYMSSARFTMPKIGKPALLDMDGWAERLCPEKPEKKAYRGLCDVPRKPISSISDTPSVSANPSASDAGISGKSNPSDSITADSAPTPNPLPVIDANETQDPARQNAIKNDSSIYAHRKYTDSFIFNVLRKAKNSEKFHNLWNGFWKEQGYLSQSDADAALCKIIAYHTKDPKQIERIFSQSKLGDREKWKNRPDYRKSTIQFILGNSDESSKEIYEETHEDLAEGETRANLGDELLTFIEHRWPKRLKTGAVAVYVLGILPQEHKYANHSGGTFFATYKALSNLSGVDTKTVGSSLKQLEDFGLIRFEVGKKRTCGEKPVASTITRIVPIPAPLEFECIE